MGILGLLLAYIILGFLRGAGDILPIEGSAHIAFVERLYQMLKMPPSSVQVFGAAEIMRLGSFFGIVSYFSRESKQLLRAVAHYLFRRQSITIRKVSDILGDDLHPIFFLWVLISLTASAAIALLMKQLLLTVNPGTVWSTLGLFINGLIISFTVLFGSPGKCRIGELHLSHFLFICIAQSFGVVPGLSRLALMICAALICRLTWKESVKLALILSLPTLLFYGVFGAYESFSSKPYVPEQWILMGAGVVVSGMSAYLAINFLLTTSVHSRSRFLAFGFYCISIGIFAYLMLFFRSS